MMNCTHEDIMSQLANDLFNKRQRLLKAGQSNLDIFDNHAAQALEAEYRAAEVEYRQAKAAFARAMSADHKQVS